MRHAPSRSPRRISTPGGEPAGIVAATSVRLAPRRRRTALGAQLPDLGCGRLVAGQLGDLALELDDPLRELLDRVGDGVGEVDPVGIRTLDLAPLDAHRSEEHTSELQSR